MNGINKVAGEWFHRLYGDVYGMRTTALRLTNTYGPRMRVRDARQTFLGIWLRLALQGGEILVYGDGAQTRDLTYVDDAVSAFLLAAARDEATGKVYNLGGEGHVSLLDLAGIVTEEAGAGSVRLIPFPPDRKSIDIGDFYADFSAIERDLSWRPEVTVSEGVRRTLDFYREHGAALLGAGRVSVPFLDLSRETARLRPQIDEAIARVLASGRFVLTEEGERFEAAFADYCGVADAIGVASGTDAITIALLAAGVSAGDEVITAPNTCVPTIVGIERAGAVPVLADIDPVTYTLDPEQVARRAHPAHPRDPPRSPLRTDGRPRRSARRWQTNAAFS